MRLNYRIFALILVMSVIPSHTSGRPSRDRHECGDEVPTIIGSKDDDKLHGTTGRDVIAGLDGDDDIRTLAGNDHCAVAHPGESLPCGVTDRRSPTGAATASPGSRLLLSD